MNYEYGFKEYIRDEILSNINHMNVLDDALDELDHVYVQAAKADEYEVKAKAFDDSLEAFEELKDFYEKVRKTTERGQIRAMIYKEVYSNVLREMKLILEESGESECL